jgi:CAP-Gly domain-containing linker protein 1
MKEFYGRYFECQPKFGLFAPAHKVTKSPSSRRPSASCMIHRGTAGPTIKRVGSRESVVSASSTASSVRGARVRLGVTSLSKTVQQVG